MYSSGHRWLTSLVRSARHAKSVTTCLTLFLALFATTAKQLHAQTMVTVQQTPLTVQQGKAQLVGAYPPEQKLRLVFALKPPHLQEEEEFLSHLQDRDSPLFHQYLGDAEWNRRFAPSIEDEQAVATWAATAGFIITQRYPNRLLVDVEAPVATIQTALQVNINTYQVGGKPHFSNDRDPALPAALSGVVQAVLGLNNIEVPHSFAKGSHDFTGPDYSPGPVYAVGSHLLGDSDSKKKTTGTQTRGKRPDYLEQYWEGDLFPSYAYDYGSSNFGGLASVGYCCNPLNNPNNSPPEASIAIAIWGDFSDSDFLQFASGLAHNVQRYSVDGTPPCCSPETTLDVEYSTLMANSGNTSMDTAAIYVYEGANNHYSTLGDVLNTMLVDGHARVLSMSWGAAELYQAPPSVMNAYHAIFDQMLGQGWTLVAASGDGGATADCMGHLSVSYPASDPDVTAGGGTTLQSEYFDGFISETGWSGGSETCYLNDGGSGGGCSAYFPAPPYQVSPACGPGNRSLPDLALNADWVNTPQLIIFDGQDDFGGGTSIVAPELAGFFAQANAYLLHIQGVVGSTCGPSYSAPCAPLGNANPYIYGEGYFQIAPHYPFYDITSGCNGNDVTQRFGLTPYCAGPGYDVVTGWGSANMLQLSWMLNDFIAGDSAGPVAAFSGPQPNHWYNSDQIISWTVTDVAANGHQPNGVAGYTFSWDVDPGDPSSEPTPCRIPHDNEFNPFYYGPIAAKQIAGQERLEFMPGYDGCHTLLVRAWDNSGQSALSADGPLCLDEVPPVTNAYLNGSLQGTGYVGPVLVTLLAGDLTSGVASTSYRVNGNPFSSYTGPFFLAVPGTYTVGFYSTDNARNVESPKYVNFTITSNSQFTLSVLKNGSGSGTVTSLDGAINCGSTCTASYFDQQQVMLTAAPAAGSVFMGWRGCDSISGFTCNVTMGSDRAVEAQFNHPAALGFVPVTPCRVVDTRGANGTFGGPSIPPGDYRDFPIPQGSCGIPAIAKAYALNVTVVPQGALGFLTMWPSGFDRQCNPRSIRWMDG